jgi:uncharacterized membrane protein required for colicin V production
MPWLDLTLVIILLGFAAYGLSQGFIRQLTNLLGFFLGLGLAIALYAPLTARLAPIYGSEVTLGPILFVAILLGVWGSCSATGLLVWKRAQARGDTWGDDVGGALLGLASGVLALAVFLAGLSELDRSFARDVESSRIGSRLLHITWETLRLLPARRTAPPRGT